MTDTRLIAQHYIDAGWMVVPVTAGSKAAATSWQKTIYKPADFRPGDNIAVKCGKPSGWRVDLDCDAPEAVKAAKLLLPHTGLIHGRPGKPDSHYWFICEGIKTTQFGDVKDASGKPQMLVEIRSTGGYTLVPPSIHPSGELLAWTIERDPLALDEKAMYEAGRNVALAALLARHYPGHGARHATIGLHLPGFLLHAGVDDLMVVQIIKAAATIAGETDWPDREKAIRRTIASFKAVGQVTGGPSLSDTLTPAVVAKMRGWLKMADLDKIEAMNARHFFVRVGNKSAIGRLDTADGQPVFQTPAQLHIEYANQSVQVGADEDGGPKYAPLFETWLRSPQRKSYGELVFAPPPRPHRPDDYNLWRDFAIEERQGDWSKLAWHMEHIICGGDTEVYLYLLKWCARLFQKPGLPGETAIVMRGDEGAGKGLLVRALARICGRAHYAHLDCVEDMTGFNALISGKVLVFGDEAFWAGNKVQTPVLKRIITEPTVRVTRKGIDSVEEPNCMHLVMATNDDWSIPAGLRARRFCAVHVSDAKLHDTEYFAALAEEIEGDGPAALLYDLRRLTVTDAEIRTVPQTEELRTQKRLSMNGPKRWWADCVELGEIHGVITNATWDIDPTLPFSTRFHPLDIEPSRLHIAYRAATGDTDTTIISFATALGPFMYDEMVKERIVRSVRWRRLRCLSDARRYWEAHTR